jgi:hypothetical protein
MLRNSAPEFEAIHGSRTVRLIEAIIQGRDGRIVRFESTGEPLAEFRLMMRRACRKIPS